MSRIPKWLMLKEYLTFDDVNKLLDSTPSSIENVLAHDCSEDFGLIFKFMCTFDPQSCQKEFKEYRFESVARQSIRTHLKDHINDMKINCSEEMKKAFSTRNQLFRSSKNVGHKHKLSVSNEVLPAKKQKNTIKSEPEPGHQITPREQRKPRVQKFTKLKKLQKSKTSSGTSSRENEVQEKDENKEVTDEIVEKVVDIKLESYVTYCASSPEDDENTTDDRMETYCSDDADGGEKISCETQTEHTGKEQETLQYKIATKLFAVDRSFWNNIGQILDDIVDAEKSPELLSKADKDMILKGMRQWMDSVQIYDKHTMSRLQDPLTPAERSTLNGLTIEDWKNLEKGQDNESKLRLTVYANMLLREYESYPRKLKPKYCQHCEKLYTASTSLYSHLVSLAGIRHWVCSRCKDANKIEATFTRKHSLQYHILKEVGIPRYRCQQPGCNRTHNHTHHQKSHARQHTGEKHYVCSVDGCRSRFSNRNTYSRHLLQFHHVELTRTNQLRAIDEKEATLKVNAARMKARERSKCKRQHGGESSKMCGSNDPGTSASVPKKRTIDENILNAAQHFLSEVKQEEGKLNDSEELRTKMTFEKSMRHSASQLLSGIARDVGSTTSLMVESKSPENMMGGLNLLATVSKYMNAKTCNNVDNTGLNGMAERNAGGEKVSDWEHSGNHEFPYTDMATNEIRNEIINESSSTETPKQDMKQSFPEVKVMTVANLKLFSLPPRPENTPQHSKLMQVIQPPFGQHKTLCSAKANSELSNNLVSQTIKLSTRRSLQGSSIPRLEHTDQNSVECGSSVMNLKSTSEASAPTVVSFNNISNASSHTEISTANNLAYCQSGALVVKNSLLSVSSNGEVINENEIAHSEKIEESSYVKQIPVPSTHSLIISRNAALFKLSSAQQSTSSNMINQRGNCTVINSSILAQSLDELRGQTNSTKTPLAALTSNTSIKCDPSIPGRTVVETHPYNHLATNNKINMSLASAVPNQTPNKNIQVIKVTNTKAQLQLRSVSCMSGKTYLVLTSSAAHPTASSDGESSSSRILPFSEL